MRNVTLTIDNKKIVVPETYTILQAAQQLGIEVPRLCYDPQLEIVSACRLCLVEIEGNPRLQTSCSILAQDGMVVETESERVVNARIEVLQLLLDNHPNDCLTCQKAGECALQKYAYRYGVKFRDHGGAYREPIIDTSSPYIFRDESKCILCGKCVRTCYQVSDRQVLSFANRGFETKIAADADLSMEESSCVSCYRCVTVCPVGALLDTRVKGKVRAWDGKVENFRCKVCEYGCDFELLYKGSKKVAVRAKSPSHGRPLCLKGRLTTEFLNLDQPAVPHKKIYKDATGEFIETSWKEAMGLEGIIEKLEKMDKIENTEDNK